jgi:hypothetical protein
MLVDLADASSISAFLLFLSIKRSKKGGSCEPAPSIRPETSQNRRDRLGARGDDLNQIREIRAHAHFDDWCL